ncbi:MAG TPA: copper resistance protein B [Woeseiaceae bacterium]|nr:copper resistance protein B [Woeseiaceae bacterium]
MKTVSAAWMLMLLAMSAAAQQGEPHAGHGAQTPEAGDHAGHGTQIPETGHHAAHGPAHDEPLPAPGAPPAAAFSGPPHAADRVYGTAAMAEAREHMQMEHGAMKSYGVLFDRLEVPIGDGRAGPVWEAQAWYGGDLDKLRIRSEGDSSSGGGADDAEVQALWSRAITTWFDVQAGLRYDWSEGPDRAHLVLGLAGLMPYRFELDGAVFVSDEGDLSARFEADYDLLITQRLILQPAAEVEIALQEVPELRLGRGFNGVELGLRLRYEVAPEFAPYAGLEWERKLGQTADLARLEGDRRQDLSVVAGVSFWF